MSSDAEIRSVDDVRRDLASVLARFRGGESFAFSFGDDGLPEAVMMTYDEFEDLGGPVKFDVQAEVHTPEILREFLPLMVAAMRGGGFDGAIPWSDGEEPEAVVLSTQQYRALRGDDEPPVGVVDDPTVRRYDTNPLPGSRAMTVDEFAAMFGPEMVAELEDIRRERGEL
jgi:hypothetical protein